MVIFITATTKHHFITELNKPIVNCSLFLKSGSASYAVRISSRIRIIIIDEPCIMIIWKFNREPYQSLEVKQFREERETWL